MEIQSSTLAPIQASPLLSNENAENLVTKVAQKALNPAAEAVGLALQFERGRGEILSKKDQETRALLSRIDQFLQVSQDISSLPDDTSPETKAKIATIASTLKSLNLIDDTSTITTREQLLEWKSLIPFQVDQLRTKVQEGFMKIQTLMQDMSSVNDTIKKLIESYTQLIRIIQQRVRS